MKQGRRVHTYLHDLYRCLGVTTLALGIDLRKIADIRFVARYFANRAMFRRLGGEIFRSVPVLGDFRAKAGTGRGHYFHQDLLVARYIYDANPERHIDVGSRIDGFVAHVAAFRTIEVIDIRPLEDMQHPQVSFRQCDLLALDESLNGITDSLSCLHALEHIGLGRYGDRIDPNGHLKAFESLFRLLKPRGRLYLSFPIGRSGVYFNAHRVFGPTEIFGWSEGKFTLERFSYVDDHGNLHRDQPPSGVPPLQYGCGIYVLRKLA